jgi:peptidoglycan LD-endopeptidase CwlK
MAKFGKKSTRTLGTAHPDLQRVFNEVVKHFDCSVICGFRGETAQQLAYDTGKSKARFGESPHNFSSSFAVDVIPYPVDWGDTERMVHFAGFVLGTAKSLGVELKWGGDWDRDTHLSDNRFDDFPHFELANWRDLRKEE